jgi:hypothetical protein
MAVSGPLGVGADSRTSEGPRRKSLPAVDDVDVALRAHGELRSWVTMMMVPLALMCSSNSMTLRAIWLSRLPVGSSARRTAASRRGARDRHALLLPPESSAGIVAHARGEAHLGERALDPLAALGRGEAAVAQRHVDVVEEVQVGNQVEAWKMKPSFRCAAASACRPRGPSRPRRRA